MIKVHYTPLKPAEIDGYDITKEIETEYHKDQRGQFARLWPEIHNAR